MRGTFLRFCISENVFNLLVNLVANSAGYILSSPHIWRHYCIVLQCLLFCKRVWSHSSFFILCIWPVFSLWNVLGIFQEIHITDLINSDLIKRLYFPQSTGSSRIAFCRGCSCSDGPGPESSHSWAISCMRHLSLCLSPCSQKMVPFYVAEKRTKSTVPYTKLLCKSHALAPSYTSVDIAGSCDCPCPQGIVGKWLF